VGFKYGWEVDDGMVESVLDGCAYFIGELASAVGVRTSGARYGESKSRRCSYPIM
jgi:hypothetical protein